MRKGITVRAEKLSELLSPFGKFSGAEKILVTARSDVFKVKRGLLTKLGSSTALGAMVRDQGPAIPQVKIVPEEGIDNVYKLAPSE